MLPLYLASLKKETMLPRARVASLSTGEKSVGSTSIRINIMLQWYLISLHKCLMPTTMVLGVGC